MPLKIIIVDAHLRQSLLSVLFSVWLAVPVISNNTATLVRAVSVYCSDCCSQKQAVDETSL